MNTFPVARLKNPFESVFMGQNTPASVTPPPTDPSLTEATKEMLEAQKASLIATKKNILSAAAAQFIDSGNKAAVIMEGAYNEYSGYATKSWFESGASFLLGPMGVMADAVFAQAPSAAKAVARIQASSSLGYQWVNDVKREWYPVFADETAEMMPDLFEQTDAVFNRVIRAHMNNVSLMKGITQLPAVQLGNYERQFWKGFVEELPKVMKYLADLALQLQKVMEALMKITMELAKLLGSASDAAKIAPWFVIGGVAVVSIWLLLR